MHCRCQWWAQDLSATVQRTRCVGLTCPAPLAMDASLGYISAGSARSCKTQPLWAAAGHDTQSKACLAPSSSASRALPLLLNSSRSCMSSAPAFSDSASSALTLSHSPASQALSVSRKGTGWQAVPCLARRWLSDTGPDVSADMRGQSQASDPGCRAACSKNCIHKVHDACTLTAAVQHAVRAMCPTTKSLIVAASTHPCLLACSTRCS